MVNVNWSSNVNSRIRRYSMLKFRISVWRKDSPLSRKEKRILEDKTQKDRPFNKIYRLYFKFVTLYAESLFSSMSTDKSLRLRNVLKKEKFAWPKLYRILDIEFSLNYGLELVRFKADWVYWLSKICGVQESVLWNYRKAGSLYADYYKRNYKNNPEIPKLENLKVSATNLVLIDRISAKDATVEDKLIGDLLAGKIHHIDLKKSWDTVKLSRKEKKLPIHPVNADDVYWMTTPKEALYVSEIISAFKDSSCIGLNRKEIHEREHPVCLNNNCTSLDSLLGITEDEPEPVFYPFEYQTVAGLETTTGKIDLAIVENLSVKEDLRPTVSHIHAITIDPNIDVNWTPPDNWKCADFLWLVIPEDEFFLAHFEEALPNNWGILTYFEGKLELKRQAQQIKNPEIEPLLRALALRLK